MHIYGPDKFIGGWFIGDFADTVLRTQAFEVAYKTHRAGEGWPTHYHAIATEINYLLRGRVRVNGREMPAPLIYVHPPGEIADIEFLEDTEMIVVKTPSVPGDKYMVDQQ